ncbi:uncharacterized protein LOC131629962 [Vicia villosa]|uniref:uncharacterized protein LOC131629962 n=1 Tax=Vicia villosa TaxID=3911 RepID=UPI00273AD10B|nr:uncharacterized protein LOC131629962 [Vicia villosa]
MEYLHRVLYPLTKNPDFKMHSKCGKLGIIEVSFAEDFLLFSRGDATSIDLLMRAFGEFSRSTGLSVNPAKCNAYYGNVDAHSQLQIQNITTFAEGCLPFRYLGIPLKSKRLSNHHCLILVEKLVSRIKHWSSRLLSFAGRHQLINSVLFAITNFWMQSLLIPKQVLKKVEAICRSFLWSRKEIITRKSPVAWERVCTPKNHGGLNIINLKIWNKVTMCKLLLNLCRKSDSLWIRWVHSYYAKGIDIMEVPIKQSCSWTLKVVLSCRDDIKDSQVWDNMLRDVKYNSRAMYGELNDSSQQVVAWRKVLFHNMARPRAMHILWRACHNSLTTNERLCRFGMLANMECYFVVLLRLCSIFSLSVILRN